MNHPHAHHARDHHQPIHDHQHFLDLDAEVFGDHLAAVLDLAGVTSPRRVVDLGAGSGAGSRLLRDRYPDAALTCVDNDPAMVERLRGQGFAVLQADLDDGFPALVGSFVAAGVNPEASIDLVWASSSLHHVAHPDRLLLGVRRALAPDGVLVVVELAGLPSFLLEPQAALLEQRCHAAAAAEGWNHYPDWTPAIQAAGLSVSKSELTAVAPVAPAAREYAQQWLHRFSQLATLTTDDRHAVQNLLARFDDLELEPRATRTVWLGTVGSDGSRPHELNQR
jgi:trans-aconitate methyltransferase